MTASVTKYNNGSKVLLGAGDFNSISIKITLHSSSYSPNVATHAVYADLSNELPTANGYTNGGLTLSGLSLSTAAGVASETAANSVWTASGGSIVARYAVVRLSGTFNSQVDPLLFYYLLDTTPADVTATNGNTLTIAYTGGNLFQVT